MLCALVLGAAAPARAQVSFSATAESDYLFRGVSLTNGKGDVKLGLAYDHKSGLYAGGAVIFGRGLDDKVKTIGHIAYAGFARRTRSGLGWEVGGTTTRIIGDLPVTVTIPSPPAPAPTTQLFIVHYDANYTEAYGGLFYKGLAAHIYLSPDYLGEGLKTAYFDLTGSVRPVEHVRLFGHVGLLTPLGGPRPVAPFRRTTKAYKDHLDARAGVALELKHAEVQLAWSTVTPEADYPVGYAQKRNALVLSASAFF